MCYAENPARRVRCEGGSLVHIRIWFMVFLVAVGTLSTRAEENGTANAVLESRGKYEETTGTDSEGAVYGHGTGPLRNSSRPSVVLFILDTLRADRLSCYGFPRPTSPRLDKLARRGILFERVLAQSSWTRPSIGSLLTGLYPRHIGIYHEQRDTLGDAFLTLAEVLKQHGYTTIGLTANPNINSLYNFDQGFDFYVDCPFLFTWMTNDTGNAGGTATGATEKVPTAPELFSHALDLVRDSGAAGPFYVQFNLMEVHEWAVKTEDRDLRRPEYRERFGRDIFSRYLDLVRQLTDDVAAFIKTVATTPGWENTLFVIVSDHGEGLRDHPDVDNAVFHGRVLYRSQIFVPWILIQRDLEPLAKRIPEPVRLLEVMPTLLDLLHIPIPEGLDGVSVMPLIECTRTDVGIPSYHVVETDFRGASKVGLYGSGYALFNHRTPHKGLEALELQSYQMLENGAKTNRLSDEPAVAARYYELLRQWETAHPPAPAVPLERKLTPAEAQQLRALGYGE